MTTATYFSNQNIPVLSVHGLKPHLHPIASQIRSYYKTLQTDYITSRRHMALLRVQQALEPIAIGLLGSYNG